jgi:hypothetical protein
MTTTIARYRVAESDAERNAQLIRDVLVALDAERPAGLRYAAFALEDGVSFVHVAEGAEALQALPAFRAFVDGVQRTEAGGPLVQGARCLGAYDGMAALAVA